MRRDRKKKTEIKLKGRPKEAAKRGWRQETKDEDNSVMIK